MHITITIVAALAVIAALEYTRRSIIMAIGNESAAALAEVKTAIAVEADQAAEKIIEAVGADADTAAAIRELLTPIKGIIPDAVVDEGGVLEPGTEGGVVVEGETDTSA
ncbi:MAG: hypothetical protein WBD41_00760 [Rhodococcus sp. (in: high G+C Gram-positive bacteria)]